MPSGSLSSARPSWAGIPAHQRRSTRRARLLDAAFDLLGSEGASGLTVRAVCRQAGLNARYFYENFDSVDSLLVAVYERTVEAMTARLVTAMEDSGGGAAGRTRAVVDAIVSFVDEDRRRGRVLYTEALGNEALNRHRLEAGRALVELVERSARDRRDGLPPGDAIVRIGAAVVVSGFAGLLQAWLEGRIEVAREQLVDDAAALFTGLAETMRRIARTRRALSPMARVPEAASRPVADQARLSSRPPSGGRDRADPGPGSRRRPGSHATTPTARRRAP